MRTVEIPQAFKSFFSLTLALQLEKPAPLFPLCCRAALRCITRGQGARELFPPPRARRLYKPTPCPLMLNRTDRGVSHGLSLALYYPEFLLPVFCSSLAPDPHLAWLDGHFARGELEEIVCSPSVCSPFKSLDVSVERGSS